MICKKCGEDKDFTEYYASKITSTGLRGACIECTKKQDKEYRQNNADKVKYSTKRKRVRREYGITLEEYDELMASSSVCECCGREEGSDANSMFCYDHDHDTGEFRGVLCRACNQAIGSLGDDIVGVRKALQYLEKHTHLNDGDN